MSRPVPGHAASSDTRPRWPLVIAVAALALAAIPLVQAAGMAPTADTGGQMVAVSPGGTVQLATLATALQELYRGAAADPEAFTAARCYCGCEQMLDHRHLLDCFVRPDGAWERHAVGCGTCRVEARAVIDARAAGTPLERIVADIDATYGGITAPVEGEE